MNIRSISPAGFTSAILLFCIVVGASFLCGSIENTSDPAAGSSGILQVGHDVQPVYENQEPVSSADVPVANFSAKAGAITRFSVFFDGTLSKGSDLSYQWSFEDGSVLSSPKPVKFFKGPLVGLVTLKVSNAEGSDSITQKVTIDRNGEVRVERYDKPDIPDEIPPVITPATIPDMNETLPGVSESPDYLQKFIEGAQFMEEGDLAGAIEALSTSITLNQSFPDAYVARGMAEFMTGYYQFYEFRGKEQLLMAVDDYTRALDQDPGNIDALLGRGAAWIYLGEYHSWRSYIGNDTVFHYYENAIKDFNKVLETDPDNIDAINGKAYATLVIGSGNPAKKANTLMVESAKKDIERSIRLNDDNPRAHFILGLYYDHEGLYPSAITEFSKAIEQDPTEAWYYEWRGFEKFQKGDYSDAIKDYSTAISLQPRFAQAYNIRGMTRAFLMNVDDRSPELSDFNQAIEINSEISEFYRNYALGLASWKYWDKSLNEHSVDVLATASELDPTDYRIHGDRAYILTGLNRNHEATQELIEYQRRSLTNEEKITASDLLAYNNVARYYVNTW
ncbi:MAG TPA: tetratricopeptide repeat protein [Methanoregulaceae archaeon]|nr:tetratricopeptide repeat protein [Methanoregulaceae archaeon]